MRGIYEKIRGNDSYSNQIFSAADYYAQESLNELSSSFGQEEISQTILYLAFGRLSSALRGIKTVDELLNRAEKTKLPSSRRGHKVVKGDYKEAKKVFDELTEGWDFIEKREVPGKGFYIRKRSLDGKYELKLRNFSTSDSKGERIKATIEVMRGGVNEKGRFEIEKTIKIKFSIKD